MLTKMKKVFFVVMFAAFALVFAACGDGGKLNKALKGIELDAEVEFGFQLPDAELEGSVTTWTSNNDAIRIDGGFAEVFRPSGNDVEVVLTATITLGEATASRDFTIIVKKLLAPDKVTIRPVLKGGEFVKSETEEGVYYLLKDKTAELKIDVADDTMSKEVNWTSGKTKYVTVDENGVIKGVGYGTTQITAQSTTAGADGACQFDRITIKVIEDLNPRKVLLNNKKFIEDNMPRFVYEDTVFPICSNPDVTVTYADSNGEEIYDGEYTWVEGADRIETIYVKLEYEGEEAEFKVSICIVTDPESNEFLALDAAKEAMDEIFVPYTGKDKKLVNASFEVPEMFANENELFTVTVGYDQETSYKPLPVSFGKDAEEKMNLIYTKPNDDSDVRIVIYLSTANNHIVVRYNVTAAGYTQAEIIEYLRESSLPKLDENNQYSTTGSHISLATSDLTRRFGALAIEWKSDNEEVLTAAGKFANPYLKEEANVKLTATVKYDGTVGKEFAFTEVLEFPFVVKPAANSAQSIALELSNYISKPEFMDKISWFPFGDLSRNENKELVNIMPLPNKISDVTTEAMKDYQDLAITWTASEEGLLGEDHKLLKQYLRYHEVALTYSVTHDGNTASNEVVINVGIAQKKDTYYIGGNFYQQKGNYPHNADSLGQLSKFDASVGDPGSSGVWGFGYGHGEFSGHTYYIDEVDKETGKTIRYQWFLSMENILYLDEGYTIDDNCKFTGVDESPLNKLGSWNNNWGTMFINVTDKEVRIPLAPHTGGGSPFVNEAGEMVPWTANDNSGRDNAFSFDGFRTAWVTDNTNKVVFGNGEGVIQNIVDYNGNKQCDAEDFWIKIPAGGRGMTFKTQCNNASINGRFCVVDTQLNFEFYDPFTLSLDGNTEGLHSLKH